MKYSTIKQEAWNKMPSYIRRQENALSKFECRSNRDNQFGFKIESKLETSYIARDFTHNALDDFDARFIGYSNENAARNFVLALKPSKKLSDRLIAMHEVIYLESLELFNLCANCQLPIDTKKVIVNGLEGELAEVYEHYEVYFCELVNRLQYRKIETHRIYNQKCDCFRRPERNANKRLKPLEPKKLSLL